MFLDKIGKTIYCLNVSASDQQLVLCLSVVVDSVVSSGWMMNRGT